MILTQNRSYTVDVAVPLNPGPGLTGNIVYPVNSSNVSLNANTALDFNIPTLPRMAVIYGNVNDGMGHVLANVTVTAYSQSLTSTPNVGFQVSGKTDLYGNYSLLVLSGTNYQLSFVPPTL